MEVALGLGLSAALAWGIASYLSAVAARQFGGWITHMGSQLATVAVLVPVGLVALQHRPAEPTALDVAVLAGVGIGSLFLDVLVYQLLTVAPVALIFPILAANGAVVAVLAVLVLGETLSTLQWAGLALTTVGVAAIAYRRPGDTAQAVTDEGRPGGVVLAGAPGRSSRPVPRQATLRVVVAAIAITVLSGVFLLIVAAYTRTLGWYQPMIIDRLAQTALIVAVLALGYPPRRDLVGHGRRWWSMLIAVGALNAAATAAYWLGVASGAAAVVATAASTFAAVPVILGILLLRERPRGHQVAGIALALAGVVALGAG